MLLFFKMLYVLYKKVKKGIKHPEAGPDTNAYCCYCNLSDVHVITWTSPKKVGSQVHVYVRSLPFLPFHLMSTINNSTHFNLT